MPIGINHDADRFSLPVFPHTVIVDFLDVPEPVPGKPVMHAFQKCNLVSKERMLIFHRFTGNGKALIIRDLHVVLPMTVKAGYLPPVHISLSIGFAVEHIGIDTADGKPPVIDPAPAVFKKPARPLGIVFYLQCIAGDIKYAILVAELGIWGRFESIGFDRPYCSHVPVEQEDMAVECPGTALRAGRAPEPDVLYNTCETVCGIIKKGVLFPGEGGDAVRDWDEGNDNHQCVRMGRVAGNIVVVPAFSFYRCRL